MTESPAQESKRKSYHLARIPLLCAGIMKDEISGDEIETYVSQARPELHDNLRRLHENSRTRSLTFLTGEERKAVHMAETLRDRELMGYHMALRYLEKYVKSSRKSDALNARRHYAVAEKTWRRLVEQMREFVLLNLAGRRPVPLF
jgi:hypothetical protein